MEWLKKPGDRVVRGDVIAVVETHKGAIEIEVFQTGTLETLIAEPGQKLAVGSPMAFIRGEGEGAAAPAAAPTSQEAQPTPRVAMPPPPGPLTVPPLTAPAGVRASPAARKRAAELAVDVKRIAGTGAGGAITLADVEHAAAAPAPSPIDAMRQAIGAAMARSKREIPHYYLAHTIDLEPALRWLEEENAKRPPPERVLYGVLLLKAVARALHEYREFNGFWTNGRFQPSERIHLGVAISIGKSGLIAPAIHDVDNLPIPQLMSALRDLVARARRGGLRSSELSDPDDHGDKPRRAECGDRLSRDLSAPGGDRRFRHGPGTPLDRRGRRCATTRDLMFSRRRPSRERWASRRQISLRRREVAPGTAKPMTDKDIRRIVLNALSGVAPELDEAALELDKSFRDQIDIDSMDFLNYVIALHDALAVDIPERDYPLLASIDGAVAYLSAQLKAAGKY